MSTAEIKRNNEVWQDKNGQKETFRKQVIILTPDADDTFQNLLTLIVCLFKIVRRIKVCKWPVGNSGRPIDLSNERTIILSETKKKPTNDKLFLSKLIFPQ